MCKIYNIPLLIFILWSELEGIDNVFSLLMSNDSNVFTLILSYECLYFSDLCWIQPDLAYGWIRGNIRDNYRYLFCKGRYHSPFFKNWIFSRIFANTKIFRPYGRKVQEPKQNCFWMLLMYIFYAFLFISPLKDFIKLLQKIIFQRSCW